jgi:hypothetical protein
MCAFAGGKGSELTSVCVLVWTLGIFYHKFNHHVFYTGNKVFSEKWIPPIK